MMNKNLKVAMAMSGGVDSGVSAALLIKQGYQVTGIHLQLFDKATGWELAQKTAQFLGIPIQKVDLSTTFKKQVIDYFLESYSQGLTPNPCVMCNKFIKFGELFDYVRKLGFDYLATGHYARVVTSDRLTGNKSNIAYHLLQALDKSKDQSYFLYNLKQEQLAHILFPVGELTKKEVRAMAKKLKLPVAQRPESQEICFLAGKDYRQFIKRFALESAKPGKVVDTKENVIGEHLGLPLYTIGQRHGFELRTNNKQLGTKGIIPPYYVISKNAAKNQLVVGFGQETEIKKFEVNNINWIRPVSELRVTSYELKVRLRSQGDLLKCKVIRNTKYASTSNVSRLTYHVLLSESQRGIAPGQAAVFYAPVTSYGLRVTGYEVLGGGIISN